MTRIALSGGQVGAAVALHSCPSCGRHLWDNAGTPVEREELLAALHTPRRPAASDRTAAAEATRRAELAGMLAGFTPHGRSS